MNIHQGFLQGSEEWFACEYAEYRTRMTPKLKINTCVSDGPADAHKSQSSAEGPFAARNG